MSTLRRAFEIAAYVHAGQVDKGGQPYIAHIMRVVLAMETNEERIVAALHDVVEDTDWELARLRAEGFSPAEISAIDALTKRPHETYDAFIVRLSVDPLARRVKIKDLEDNMDLGRIPIPSLADRERYMKYRRARAWLLSESGAGRPISADAPKSGDALDWRPGTQDLDPVTNPAASSKADFNVKDLLDSGLLFEINRVLLHPYGIVMSVRVDEGPGAADGAIFLHRTNDKEGMVFDRQQLIDGFQKLDAFHSLLENVERSAARNRLGFFVQRGLDDLL